ncbi:hypothetical protein ABW19_dt0204912 [Dactylella cylindrospora]|nr:hypothetical protein ABW19_dt0204912 [Dactylella cylindrospora]
MEGLIIALHHLNLQLIDGEANPGLFQGHLQSMPTETLNRLDISQFPRAGRRLLNDERVRRSRGGAPIALPATVLSTANIPIAIDNRNSSGNSNTSGRNNNNFTREASTKPASWSLQPQYHGAVAKQVPGARFHSKDEAGIREYPTFIMGYFACLNKKCKIPGWGSKKIKTIIHGFRNNEYNARVYHQRCKSCNRIGNLELDEECYVSRIVYRLKKWRGDVSIVAPPYRGDSKGPHRTDLCVACDLGICDKVGGIDSDY